MVHVWVVLVLFVIIGMIGFSLDVSYGLLVAQQLQNAADSASRAGARLVRSDAVGVRDEAVKLAYSNSAGTLRVQLDRNEANAADGDIVIGHYTRATRVFVPTLSSPNAVKVVARRTASSLNGSLPLAFAPAFGVDTIEIQRDAIAMVGGGTGAGLITLNETEKWTFRLSGNVTLEVFDISDPYADGAIQVNSINTGALKSDGDPTLVAEVINVKAPEVTDPPDYDGETRTNQPRLADPLADIAPPGPTEWGTDQGEVKITGGTHFLQPGFYPDGIEMTGGNVYLAPGVYVLDGHGLEVMGGNIAGEGVMFYVIDSTPGDNVPSHVNLTGNGSVEVTPMDLETGGDYGGILIWQARDNTNEATIRGTDEFEGLEGTVYFPVADVDVTGTSDTFAIRQLICDSCGISGNGVVSINYDGRYPAPGTKVFLVK
jgi:hypothetical protein